MLLIKSQFKKTFNFLIAPAFVKQQDIHANRIKNLVFHNSSDLMIQRYKSKIIRHKK